MGKRIGTLYAPERSAAIPVSAQWVLGQGAGAWFCIEQSTTKHHYKIQRYAANENLDCDRIFVLAANGANFDLEQPYEFTTVSHCSIVRIIQQNQLFIFHYKGE
jgi:hypothetical protein